VSTVPNKTITQFDNRPWLEYMETEWKWSATPKNRSGDKGALFHWTCLQTVGVINSRAPGIERKTDPLP